ncbi:MAG: lamin tail domain-containing protein [Candidatus Promineifilaceae bacterium]|nr:lamin tail domain-containing protein [Candidatus Promineifilaceae bacterium]
MSIRRMLPFIFINVVVSAVVVLLILAWWDNRQEEIAATSTPLPAIGGTMAAGATSGPAAAPTSDTTAEPTAEGESDDGPTIHVVQAGETLGRISQLYDVPVEDIAEANDIFNVNSISVGQELVIPIGGLPTATPLPTASPTADEPPTPRPTEPLPEGTADVEITEVVGVGDLAAESVLITNAGTRPLSLLGWELEDEQGNVYTFVDITLYGSGDAGSPAIVVHTEAGQNTPSDLYWGQETAVWETGETATLRDAEGTVQATYVIP